MRLNGFPIHKAKALLSNIQSNSDLAFEEYIEKRKREIVDYHVKHNSFYKSFSKGVDIDNWNNIPVMTKRDLQVPLKERLSDNYTFKNCHVHKTSGSSGTPFYFAKDKFCHALTWSVFMNRYHLYGINLNSSMQARFYGIPLDKKGYYKERFKDFLSKRYRFSVFDLSPNEFEKNLSKFKATRFEYINGYTSAIVQFAKFLEQKKIVLKEVCPTLKICIVTSEMLFEDDRALLETQFGIPVINEYGAAELGLIAFQNPKGDWQLNQDDLFVEILDENGAVLPYGKEGRVVITSLYNKAHPFIRYDIGDIGVVLKDPSSRALILNSLIGRSDDIIILPSGKKAAGLTCYYITKSVIENDGNVKAFIIEQLELSLYNIKYVSSKELSEEKIEKVKSEMAKYLESGLTIIFEKQNELHRSKSGKLKQFSSHMMR